METNDNQRVVELHQLAAHAHLAAAVAHGKGDHLSASELSRKAHEHSTQADEHSHATVMTHGKARSEEVKASQP